MRTFSIGVSGFIGRPEERLVARVVDAAAAPRVAAEEAPAGEHEPAEDAELAERVERVARAARVVLAALAEERADERAVGVDGERDDVPHAAVPSARRKTSSTRSVSHGKPRLSTASARPGRAIST